MIADAADVVNGALAFDDDGPFGSEVPPEFGGDLIADFEQGGRGRMNDESARHGAPPSVQSHSARHVCPLHHSWMDRCWSSRRGKGGTSAGAEFEWWEAISIISSAN